MGTKVFRPGSYFYLAMVPFLFDRAVYVAARLRAARVAFDVVTVCMICQPKLCLALVGTCITVQAVSP